MGRHAVITRGNPVGHPSFPPDFPDVHVFYTTTTDPQCQLLYTLYKYYNYIHD